MRALLNHERVTLLRERGGMRSLGFWLLRQVLSLDVYMLFALPLRDAGAPLPPGCTLLRLASADDLARCPAALLDQIDPHTGSGVRKILAQGARIYAIVQDGVVHSQTRIDVGTAPTESPCLLTIEMGPRNAFVSFLYTHEGSRRGGWAKKLLAAAAASMAREGLQVCFSHVQATNLRSVNTFMSLGWRRAGWILATRRGRYLGTAGAAHGLRVLRTEPIAATEANIPRC